ncbi:MAG: acyl-ACP thioesterase domain-containing protein [Bacteroidota bacterium]
MITSAPPSGYEVAYQIRTSEIDDQRLIRIPALLQLMQEASMQNVIQLSVSVWDLQGDSVSWVLLRKELTVHRYPTLNERIKVLTYPSGFDRVFAYRDYLVYDDKGMLVASASSTWTLMNLNSRKISRIPESYAKYVEVGPDQRLPLPSTKIPLVSDVSDIFDYTFRNYDLDWNGHVNNVNLVKLLIEGLDPIQPQERPFQFIYHIRAECRAGQKVTVSSAPMNEEKSYCSVRDEEGQLLVAAQAIWG